MFSQNFARNRFPQSTSAVRRVSFLHFAFQLSSRGYYVFFFRILLNSTVSVNFRRPSAREASGQKSICFTRSTANRCDINITRGRGGRVRGKGLVRGDNGISYGKCRTQGSFITPVFFVFFLFYCHVGTRVTRV